MRLTDYFIKKQVQTLSHESVNRSHTSCMWNEVKHILLFYQTDYYREEIEECLNKLGKTYKKKVYTCIFHPMNSKMDLVGTDCVVLTNKDLNIWQIPSNTILKQVQAIQADLIMDLTSLDCYPMKYLMLQHPCKFKVGVKHSFLDLYDLSIVATEQDNLKQIFEQIIYYLQAVRSK